MVRHLERIDVREGVHRSALTARTGASNPGRAPTSQNASREVWFDTRTRDPEAPAKPGEV